MKRLADETDWVPEYFEFAFGLPLGDPGRDPRSLPEPVVLDGRFRLRGSVDLIERHVRDETMRVTDHKTGRNRSTGEQKVGGGTVLQPILYGLVVEQALGRRVESGRLYFATTAGAFAEHEIPLNDYARQQGLEVLTIIDRAIDTGFFAAAPAERACTWCDFRPVCGPREEDRVKRKAADRLADLHALRSMR